MAVKKLYSKIVKGLVAREGVPGNVFSATGGTEAMVLGLSTGGVRYRTLDCRVNSASEWSRDLIAVWREGKSL